MPDRPVPDDPDGGPPAAVAPAPAPAGPPGAPEEAPEDERAALRAARRERRRERYLIPALAFVAALAVGALVIIFSDPEVLPLWGRFFSDPLDALRGSGGVVADSYRALLTGGLGSPIEIARAIGSGELEEIRIAFRPLSETIIVATPLIFAGLAVALPFRAGLFNIGAEGQITAGALLAAVVGFSFPGLPGPLHLLLIVLAGFVGGLAWGGIAGVLKAKTGAHEVITTIMLNWIAIRLSEYLLRTDFFRRPGRTDPISRPVLEAFPRLFGGSLRVHLGILVAVLAAAMVAFLVNRTTVGFEFRAVGANPEAARTAGMSPTRIYMVIMALAGGLAGLGGANQLLSTTPSLTPGFSSGYGFDAIALALLGRSKPAGVVAAGLLFGMLRAGSRSMQAATATPVDIVVVVQALVIAFIAAPALVRGIFRIKARREAGLEALMRGWSG